MCAHACQFFALFCFPLILLCSYVDFIIVILSFYRVIKAGAFVCCRFTIGVKIKEKFLKNVRTHLNSCCFCASYKWKNNNNSCRLFTSTKALRCSLFFSPFFVLVDLCCCHYFCFPVRFLLLLLLLLHHVRTFCYYVIAISLTLRNFMWFFLRFSTLYIFISILHFYVVDGIHRKTLQTRWTHLQTIYYFPGTLGEAHSIHLKTFSKVNNSLVC